MHSEFNPEEGKKINLNIENVMDKFKKIARKLVARRTTHGTSKANAKLRGDIASIGTERGYRQCVLNYLRWCKDNEIHPDFLANGSTLETYLEERSEFVQQKTLNMEHQALQVVYNQKLPYLRSINESIYEKRSYSLPQIQAIIARQSEKNAITTWLAFFAGIRAHESATILPINERCASTHRAWDVHRFLGLSSYHLYSVIGKGGLIREVAVPSWLAIKLEAKRRPHPLEIVDREIIYLSYYAIGIGQNWSQSFSAASKHALGYSTGGHGARHSYAKWRLHNLIDRLESINQEISQLNIEQQALLILSQELGHFRLDIVYCYLR